jgi:hypothetical protein
MSEGVAHGADAAAHIRSQPAFGEGRLSYEEPPTAEEHLDGGTEIALAFAIFAPVVVAYGAIVFGLYQAVTGLI